MLRVISDQVPVPDLTRATAEYLDFLLNRYRYLDLRGMGISDRVSLELPLLEMYIPLRARVGKPEGETWARKMRIAGREPTEEEVEAMGRRLSEPQPVLTLLANNPGLIVLGDPGAGKTTFLKFLTLALATGQGESLGLGQRLPVLVPLSSYADALAQKDVPLNRFITDYYRDRGVSLPLGDLLDQALERGAALLLTILALMKRQGVILPERRVELYEQYVRTLLKHWNLARSLSGRGGDDLDLVETLKVLAPLALWMHRTSPGVGLVRESDLGRELERIYTERGSPDPEREAWTFLEMVTEIGRLLGGWQKVTIKSG